ncbi:MAG TPA: hypothetical protein PLY35_08215 [Thermotogota bacterium]|nr:hypothetical protein [Thermotogota bacterium]
MIKLKPILLENFSSELQLGQLIINSNILYQYLGMIENSNYAKAFEIGTIGSNVHNQRYASFIYNRSTSKIIKININSGYYKKLNNEEIQLIKKSLKDPAYKQYLELAYKTTGFKIKL